MAPSECRYTMGMASPHRHSECNSEMVGQPAKGGRSDNKRDCGDFAVVNMAET